MSKTALFRALHNQPDQPLILPNIWDVGGAKPIESLGAKAVATTSAGAAWSVCWPDGNRLPAQQQTRLATDILNEC
jgi:2-methylisocitrate lyase-like PEP mutase family enzyme